MGANFMEWLQYLEDDFSVFLRVLRGLFSVLSV